MKHIFKFVIITAVLASSLSLLSCTDIGDAENMPDETEEYNCEISGHVPEQDKQVVASEPTCYEDGVYNVLCKYCGSIVESGSIPATEHSFEDGYCTICSQEEYSSGIVFELNDDQKSYRIVRTEEHCDEPLIPSSYKGLPVTVIGAYAFTNFEGKTLNIPDSITVIEEYAFAWAKFASVNIGKGVKEIERYAFSSCDNLVYISVPNNVEVLGPCAFQNCKSLKNATLGGGVKTLKSDTFAGCSSLESFTANEGLVTIEESAFNGCKKLKSVSLPESLEYIEDYAFYYLDALESIYIPGGVKRIGESAFFLCSSLSKVVIDGNGIEIDDYAFSSCNLLYDITLPSDIQYIGYRALPDNIYGNCGDNLNEYNNGYYLGNDENKYLVLIQQGRSDDGIIRIHPDTKIIDSFAFNIDEYGKSYGRIILPNGLVSISYHAFTNIQGDRLVAEYNYTDTGAYLGSASNPYLILVHAFGADDGGVYKVEDSTRIISAFAFQDNDYVEEIVLPELTRIGNYAFSDCESLKRITIPDTVTKIDDGAFLRCSSLESIVIPDSVTELDKDVFAVCSSLKEVKLPESITRIKAGTFSSCSSLEEITIPESVHTIEKEAFKKCTALSKMTVHKGITFIGKYAFEDCGFNGTITYEGTCEEWAQLIERGDPGLSKEDITTVICSDGNLTP